MSMKEKIKHFFNYIQYRFKENNIDNIIWMVDIVPKLAGFSLEKETVRGFTPFWVIHLSLLFYLYGVGNVNYQLYHAVGAGDYVKSYVNISLLALILNNSLWWLNQRPLLKSVLAKLKWSDEIATRNLGLRKKHTRWLKIMKLIVAFFLGMNHLQAFAIYLPARVDINNDFSMTPCVGLEPLTTTPNKQICLTMLMLQEFSIMIVTLNFQTLLIVLIAHTAAMYELLAYDLLEFDKDYVDNNDVKRDLPLIIQRHAVILDITNGIKSLYSIPIGTNFGSNAICISFFFYLPLEESLGFVPILAYCFMVFFLYCFLCQNLVNSAELFERCVYGCGWEKFDVKERKTLYVMLIQAQQKVEILAADIVPVNIYTFATTCQFMFKFVTVVKF